MASIKTLSKSLVAAVSDVVTKSEQTTIRTQNRLFSEGLKKFGVSSISELSENQIKALHSWVQSKLQEASCGCEDDMQEDDMPGDAPFHKGGDEDGEKKKEIDEEDDEDQIKESIALGADEIATNGAVGVTDADQQFPVHADVLRDSSPVDGKTELRLFVQFNTNTLPVIVPPVTLPGAPTLDALRDIVEGLPFFCDVCDRALSSAADLPHESPSHNEQNVTEAYVPTQYDKKVIAAIKQVTKAQKVQVEDYTDSGVHIREYSAVLEKSGSEDVLYFGCMESPSRKSPGKMTWTIRYELNDENADPNVGGQIKSVVGEPFPAGVELKSLSTLKSVLAKLPID